VTVFDTPGRVALRLIVPSGRVEVTTGEEPVTEVKIVAPGVDGDALAAAVSVGAVEIPGGHEITVEVPRQPRSARFWNRGGVDIFISCPHGADVDFASASADLAVRGRVGAVGAKSASGDLRIEHVAGPARVNTASGDVSLDVLEQNSTVNTVSGDVSVARATGALTMSLVSGDVRLGFVSGAASMSTASGDVSVETLTGGELRIQTISGDVRVGVAHGTGVWIDAQSVSGDLASELDLREADGAGAASGPAVPLQVKTVSGDVAIVRAPESVG
jgi:hypothetical protein